ncbi:cytidylyltransferase domain-containing protein [Oligoflexus tunisiensis]|uniref:cytidylyltransferase domain-containing protein n=1 Tax=Oligoflexus tunisiensis TaxID=708132 RepID=UPI00114C88E7|nr:hypothetical protein [Oligoflexus tunisiensis]
MTVICAIPVRLGSKRLRRKHLIEAHGKTFLEWLVLRLVTQQKVLGANCRYVIASTIEEENAILKDIATDLKIDVFFGDSNNIPRRLSQAIDHFDASGVICVDGDDIACSPHAVSVVEAGLQKGENYLKTCGLPLGMNVAGFSRIFLNSQLQNYGLKVLETGWSRIFDDSIVQTVDLVHTVPAAPVDLRFTLDYEEDARFFKAIINELGVGFLTANDAEIVRCVIEKRLYELVDGTDSKYWENFLNQLDQEDSSAEGSHARK